SHFARLGQWARAREVYLLLVESYPTHPLAVDASRWLIQHGTSTEARRRQEVSQFVLATHSSSGAAPGGTTGPRKSGATLPTDPEVNQERVLEKIGNGKDAREWHQERHLGMIGSLKEARQWYQQSLDLGGRLAALGPLFASDPSMQFCLQAARRQ